MTGDYPGEVGHDKGMSPGLESALPRDDDHRWGSWPGAGRGVRVSPLLVIGSDRSGGGGGRWGLSAGFACAEPPSCSWSTRVRYKTIRSLLLVCVNLHRSQRS